MERIHTLVRPDGFAPPPTKVLCDVDNPLCGARGAAHVFGPQKGAGPEEVERLEQGLAHLADLVQTQLGIEVRNLPGAGAAGGLAAGAVAFLDAKLVSGIDTVMEAADFRNVLSKADWVVTGEGSFDEQSLDGKVISGILRVAKETATRVAVIAGTVKLAESAWRAAGIDYAASTSEPGMPLDIAIAREPELLAERIRAFADAKLR